MTSRRFLIKVRLHSVWRHTQVARERSAKPLFTGSNPVAASKEIKGLANLVRPFSVLGVHTGVRRYQSSSTRVFSSSLLTVFYQTSLIAAKGADQLPLRTGNIGVIRPSFHDVPPSLGSLMSDYRAQVARVCLNESPPCLPLTKGGWGGFSCFVVPDRAWEFIETCSDACPGNSKTRSQRAELTVARHGRDGVAHSSGGYQSIDENHISTLPALSTTTLSKFMEIVINS